MYRADDPMLSDLLNKIDELQNQVSDLKEQYYKLSGESHSTFLYGCEVRGSEYFDLEKKVIPKLNENDPVLLLREKDNEFDKNAIAVATPSGLKMGYIPRQHNLVFSRMIDNGNLLYGRVKKFHWDGKKLELVVKVYMA